MKLIRTLARLLVLTGIAVGIIMIMGKNKNTITSEGYIGQSDIVIKDGHMTPEALLALGRLSDPQVSPDGEYILYGVSYTSTADNRSCRNLFICKKDGSDRQQLTKSGKSLSNARWINGGKGIAFVMGGQIWTGNVKHKSGAWSLSGLTQISNVPAGISEFKLSPDQSKLIYVSTVKSSVKTPADCYADLDKAEAFTTDDLMYRHWDHTVMELPHSFIADFSAMAKLSITPESSVDILADEPETYELPAEPFSGIEQLDWSPDGKYIAYSCRKLTGKKYAFSTNTDIYIYNIESAKASLISTAGGYDTDPVWSPDASKICWVSMERDGYEADKQRLIVADLNWEALDVNGCPAAENITDVTADFKYNVGGPSWDENGNEIYFASLAEGLQGIFKAVAPKCCENSGCTAADCGTASCGWEIERLTDDTLWYDFGSPFYVAKTEDGSLEMLATWCSMDFPTELVSIISNEMGTEYKSVTTENDHILSQLASHETEARYVKTVDGKDMLTWVLYPPQFDPAKKYPSILICLGGPQGTLSQGWSYRWNYRLMASQGYVVVLPNRRGTTAFGQEWTEQISGDYPGLNMQDYLCAAREVKAEPYVDKMAACGASYGGYSVFYLCGTHENTFDAFIAHAGIFNEEHMYMTTEEMWFPNFDNGGVHECQIDPRVGTPEAPMGPAGDGQTFGGIRQGGSPWSDLPKTKRHYELSPHKLVTKWNTPLMVIHGGMDYRVPVDQGMAAYNAAQLMGVPSRLLIFPDENHWILKPQNALMWHREYFKWLDSWCK